MFFRTVCNYWHARLVICKIRLILTQFSPFLTSFSAYPETMLCIENFLTSSLLCKVHLYSPDYSLVSRGNWCRYLSNDTQYIDGSWQAINFSIRKKTYFFVREEGRGAFGVLTITSTTVPTRVEWALFDLWKFPNFTVEMSNLRNSTTHVYN